jgi:hypothetical protein
MAPATALTVILTVALLAAPIVGEAQQPKIARLGVLLFGTLTPMPSPRSVGG